MRIFLTGGTGLVGTRMVARLQERGHLPVLLTRRSDFVGAGGVEVVVGDPTKAGPWQDVAAGCDAMVNLAGENLFAKRWNESFKAQLRESRVTATANCAAALVRAPKRADGLPKVLVSASAIGYYGPHGDEELDDSAGRGDDFLAGVCADWESAARPAADAGVRVVFARIGVVLAKEGGALKMMLPSFKLCGGGPVASGKQYLSWVHRDDVVEMILFALDRPQARGPMNVTAPNPRTNKEFSKALGRALGRPAFMWMPGPMLHLVMGGAAHIIITGQRVLPKRAQQWGYAFRFPDLDAALADILKS